MSAYTYNNHVLSLVKSESNYYYDSIVAVGAEMKNKNKKKVMKN